MTQDHLQELEALLRRIGDAEAALGGDGSAEPLPFASEEERVKTLQARNLLTFFLIFLERDVRDPAFSALHERIAAAIPVARTLRDRLSARLRDGGILSWADAHVPRSAP